MKAEQIRKKITSLVEDKMRDDNVTLQKVKWDTWCPFVNPLCPGDLCILPRDHPGVKEGYHVTGTTAYDNAIKWPLDYYEADAPSQEWLIEEGWRRQAIMFPRR